MKTLTNASIRSVMACTSSTIKWRFVAVGLASCAPSPHLSGVYPGPCQRHNISNLWRALLGISSRCQLLNMTLNVEKNTQLTRFRAQYLQLLDPRTLSWPPHTTLKRPDVQAWLFKNLFDKQNLQYLPSDRYQTRVLKMVLARIEESIEDPDQDVSAITSNPV
jgi:hypothetical protein